MINMIFTNIMNIQIINNITSSTIIKTIANTLSIKINTIIGNN